MSLPELCILFLHHRDNAVTRLHYDKLRRSNPDVPIVALCDEPRSSLPGAIDVSRFPSRWNTRDKWRNVDTMLYRWFENRTVEAERYLMLEYDCWCDVDMRDYYREHWAADLVAANHPIMGQHPWVWFDEVPRFAPEDRPFAAGVWPLACTMLSHRGLEAMMPLVSTTQTHCELRLATAARRAGLRVETLTGEKHARISYREYPERIVAPGLYHAVKSPEHNLTRALYKLKWAARPHLSFEVRKRVLAVLDRSAAIRRWLGRD